MNNERVCPQCKKTKNIIEFYSGHNRSWCRRCLLDFQMERWLSRKKKAVELLGGKCCKCKYDKNYAALHFHHLDPNIKEFDWNKVCKRPWEQVINELKKCILLCANCHAEIHHPQNEKTIGDVINNHANRSLNQDSSVQTVQIIATGICPICSKETYGTIYCCKDCSAKSQRKVDRPSKEELMEKMKNGSYCSVAREYGVSDNAIRKWIKYYNKILDTP